MLALFVRNLEKPVCLTAYLAGMGQMHVAYGAQESHFPAVGKCLLVTLEQIAGNAWNDRVKQTWMEAYGVVAKMMLDGARKLNHKLSESKETPA